MSKPDPDSLVLHVPPPVQGSSLTTAIRRLEAATSRLEDIASSSAGGFETASSTPAPSTAPSQAPASSSQRTTPNPSEALPPSVQDYDAILDGALKTWLELSAKLGSSIAEQVGEF